ncbi:WD_REPEATS_REGION domain-containing protein [Nephila pilipes]|uniref:WD_REPEATS_REGION domain-containing protein n=1 Tax=Nephila pilipes TaxID=299642 RepID=A0A8X6UK15_NEPPI|nr:WD_REPEATS_REGION domain-containing protein [Nephila pilipes]
MDTSSSQESTDLHRLPPITSSSAWEEVLISGNVKILAKHEGENPALCCSVFPLNKQFAIGWSNGKIELRDTNAYCIQKTFDRPQNLSVTCVSVDESDKSKPKLLASYASGHTSLWDIKEGTELLTLKHERQTLVNAFNSNGSSFAIGGSDAKIQIHDTETGAELEVLQGTSDPEIMDGHTNRVYALRYHPTRFNDLLSGGWDDTVQFWDVRYPYSQKKINGPHICNNGGIEFWNEDKFVTASWRKRDPLQIWNYETNSLISDVNPDEENCFLYCCKYVEPEELLLVGGSHKNMLRVVDINAKMEDINVNIFQTIASLWNLKGAVYFAKELPKLDETSFSQRFCFCAENNFYIAQIDI